MQNHQIHQLTKKMTEAADKELASVAPPQRESLAELAAELALIAENVDATLDHVLLLRATSVDQVGSIHLALAARPARRFGMVIAKGPQVKSEGLVTGTIVVFDEAQAIAFLEELDDKNPMTCAVCEDQVLGSFKTEANLLACGINNVTFPSWNQIVSQLGLNDQRLNKPSR